jgi:hypothetical protein
MLSHMQQVLIGGLVLAISASRPFGGHQPLESLIQLVASTRRERQPSMLWTIALILIVLWVLGLVSSYTLGGFVHILLVLAIVVILIRVIQGRRIA